ncbi:MAG: phage baseplate assembly protein [Myxococcales bacterium]|nr:phage baseplate assembly protein [Myxococcales bacterium]
MQYVDAAVDVVWNRLVQMVSLGTLSALDNTPGVQLATMKLDADDDAFEATVYTPPGISSRPAAGAEAIVLAVGGNASNLFVLPIVRGQRLTGDDLAEGEVALFIGVAGQRVHLKLDGSVEIRASTDAGGSIVLKANGDVVATPGASGGLYLGDEGATKKVALADEVDARLNTIQATFDAHVHSGVTAGMGSTAVTPTLIGPLDSTAADNVYGKG